MSHTWDQTTDVMLYTDRIETTHAPWQTLANYSNVDSIDGGNAGLICPTYGVGGGTQCRHRTHSLMQFKQGRVTSSICLPKSRVIRMCVCVGCADGHELFIHRINTGRTSFNPHVGSGNTLQVPVSRVLCVLVGKQSRYGSAHKMVRRFCSMRDLKQRIVITLMIRGCIRIT